MNIFYLIPCIGLCLGSISHLNKKGYPKKKVVIKSVFYGFILWLGVSFLSKNAKIDNSNNNMIKDIKIDEALDTYDI